MRPAVIADNEDVARFGDVDRLDGFCPVSGDGSDRHRSADRFYPAADGDDIGHGAFPVHSVGDVRRRDRFQQPADGSFRALLLPWPDLRTVDGIPDPPRCAGHVGGLDDVSPHNNDRGSGGDRLGCGLCIESTCDSDGDTHLPGKATEEVERRSPDHLLVDADVGVDIIDTECLKLAGSGSRILNVDEISHDPDTILPG